MNPPDTSSVRRSHEVEYPTSIPGILMVFVCILLIPLLGLGLFLLRGLVLVEPNQSLVVMLFGRYKGTIRRPGFFWINPFTNRHSVTLRVRNFQSERLKVNDLRGNPVEIAAVVVWRVHDTAQATFDVQNYESYVAVQTESSLRASASKHPYDSAQPGQTSLRGDSEEVNAELKQQLIERLSLAGVEVLEVRLMHLAYAAEIAGVMLRRQQAEAIIDARTRIVEGAVSMVKMALDQLKEHQVVTLDEGKKAAMVSNLLVVLCSESETTPVVNAGMMS